MGFAPTTFCKANRLNGCARSGGNEGPPRRVAPQHLKQMDGSGDMHVFGPRRGIDLSPTAECRRLPRRSGHRGRGRGLRWCGNRAFGLRSPGLVQTALQIRREADSEQ